METLGEHQPRWSHPCLKGPIGAMEAAIQTFPTAEAQLNLGWSFLKRPFLCQL